MISKIIIFVFHIFIISLESQPSKAQSGVRVGYYWYKQKDFPISTINSSLFTHLICGFADLDSTSYQLSLSSTDEKYFSTFTQTVQQKNPSVTTLLSIGGEANYSTFSSMVSNFSYRKSFIDSSIKAARLHGFHGLDFYWVSPTITRSDMFNMEILFKEWRSAVGLEERNSSQQQQLILTTVVQYSTYSYSGSYPMQSIQQYVNWIHVINMAASKAPSTNFTAAITPLYNPSSSDNVDYGIRTWLDAGLPANKLVMGFVYFGYAWTLVNPKDNGIGAPAIGPALSPTGFMTYKEIKNYVKLYGGKVMYNSTYVVNYVTVRTSWISFDDVEAIRAKVSYVKEKGLLGYSVWQVSHDDDNWVLSKTSAGQHNGTNSAAQEDTKSGQIKKQPWPFRLLVFILPTIAAIILLSGLVIYYLRWMRKFKSKESVNPVQESRSLANNAAAAGDFIANTPSLVLYSLADIEVATDRFSIQNKLGEGGYGPVYKGVLLDGQEIAVKKLSKTSTQGFEEFKNEVMLTAKLQHINLVRLLGFCIDNEEQMLIYEFMLNKSLDYYLFDPVKKNILDWIKCVDIIDGVCQGFLYLQEYSRLTIIHRDLKASNVLLDKDLKPKIADFGMARIFTKQGMEANTVRIVGTYGYAPPEYLKKGIYSIKSDVYSFGILLLQIISGKRVSILYGEDEHLSLVQYAYELWKVDKGMEFMDPSLDDTYSPCKLIKCLHIALLCVQEIPIDRPSMLEVSRMLKNEARDLIIPKKPAFLKQTHEDVQHESTTSNLEIGSVNDTTFSDLQAR